MLNSDYRDILRAFSAERVEFLLVGAYAMAAHGYPRSTVDLHLWIRPSAGNAAAVMRALGHFGAPTHEVSIKDFEKDDMVFQIGVAPRRIDIITTASGLQFEATFANAVAVDIKGLNVRVPCVADLIRNKKATGRTKDLADAEALEALQNLDGSA